jgi:hypothetical protein
VIASAQGPECIGTQAVAEEISRHLPGLAAKRSLDLADAGIEVFTTGDLLDALRDAG